MEQYYIVRANGAGVFFGKVEGRNGDEVTMTDVRKLWRWYGACAVEQLAMDGTKQPDDCMFTKTVPEMTIMNVLQIIKCSSEAVASIKAVKEWKQ